MAEKCHYCRERITRHEDVSEVMDDGPTRIYHDDCHYLDILAHRKAGNRLPEDQPGPPMTLPTAWKR